jgi:D-glycero-D-manno-heptose 1,7-bisphosphate phosphatase
MNPDIHAHTTMFPTGCTTDRYRHLPSHSRLAVATPAPTPSRPDGPRRAMFLDRDGVLVEDVHYLRRAADLRLLPGVVPALRLLQEHFFLIVVTNQSGIARGLLTEADLLDIHNALVRTLALEGVILDVLYYCPHLPEASVRLYRQVCSCRKPAPGMVTQARQDWNIALDDSFMVGDSLRDVQAGAAAGVPGFLLTTEPPPTDSDTFHTAASLLDAAHLIRARLNLVAHEA